MKIVNLKESMECFDKIAIHHQREWAHLNNGETLEERKVRMQAYLTNDFIPTMYVAEEDNNLIGTAAIIECDMDTKPNLTPWMASVFILQKHRKKGYGSVLVKHIMKQAKQNGIEEIYLYTEDADYLYSKLGWKPISREQFQNQNVVVMNVNL